ncbi:retinol dehydrogenase 12-like isoform X1 [Bacillus rossius redtenbacheri]|uniref:retinol dehydrogenase 12-like isoform X1 n=1 Tax=Bacillus rossius redtenbacheri TaxID=93214 RepID=UPI002FDEF847
MVTVVLYVIFPVVIVAAGLIRKWQEKQWGKCKSQSSLQDKVFIVTGANSGIGKETARGLVKRKARVIMACRDLSSARNAIEDIRHETSSGELIPIHLDLSSLMSVREFVSEVLKEFPKIHVLINNAGVYIPVEKNCKTKEGFEIHFGVNHLGHFLLTNLLIPRLRESAPARVVTVSSTLHERGRIELDDPRGERGFPAGGGRHNPGYCNSKLANVLFTRELARRLQGSGVDAHVLCPGFTYTGLFRHTPVRWYHYVLVAPVALYALRTAAQGAETVLHCATEESLEGISGLMYRNCAVYKSKATIDEETAEKLWAVSEELCGLNSSL